MQRLPDCSEPGRIHLNTYNLTARPLYFFTAIVLHESVPGHHLQLALQEEGGLPDFRAYLGPLSYIEGWALYAGARRG